MKTIRAEEMQRQLDAAAHFHGHLCGGQVLGVRMAMAALREMGIDEPRGPEGRDLVIFVESDRCPTDAIIAVTGRTPGKRSIKMVDYGKVAATFVDTRSGNALRVSLKPGANERIAEIARAYVDRNEKEAQLAAAGAIDEIDLLNIERVRVAVAAHDLPGTPLETVDCEQCGEAVKDGRHVCRGGRVLCQPCATGFRYYTSPAVAWTHELSGH